MKINVKKTKVMCISRNHCGKQVVREDKEKSQRQKTMDVGSIKEIVRDTNLL